MKCKIGIRPAIDGRWGGIREGLEAQTMAMARSAKKLIEDNITYADGTMAQVVIAPSTIGGGKEAYDCEEFFSSQNVTATITVTPCWCYGSETMDLNPLTTKAVWGFNGTERPGAVYLAAAMSAHSERGLPAFSIYGEEVQDQNDTSVPSDVVDKILRFSRCSLALAEMKNKSYVAIGSVAMGIAGSFLDPQVMQEYFGIRAEWVDMIEIQRRVDKGIFDKAEYEKALAWTQKNCPYGDDNNITKDTIAEKDKTREYCVKMTLIISDIMYGNPKLKEMGFFEEALGRNAILGGFQGQRQWTDYLPNADFSEAILNSSFDWNGRREPKILATENDTLNGMSMLFGKLLTGKASVFADVRTYWSPDSVKRVTGYTLTGRAKNGFMHLINSGAASLDGTGACLNASGENVMKKWTEITEQDITAMLAATRWASANKQYFRGGGFSSQFSTTGEMPVTLVRLNRVKGVGLTLQIAEGYTLELPAKVNKTLLDRTDPTWPSTWFAPILTGEDAFDSVYNVMASWGANHGAFCYGHVGDDLITLASMLRIPVSLHNVSKERIYRPHSFSGFGTKDLESADYRACNAYGALYK